MSNEHGTLKPGEENDEELDNILDNALSDFDKIKLEEEKKLHQQPQKESQLDKETFYESIFKQVSEGRNPSGSLPNDVDNTLKEVFNSMNENMSFLQNEEFSDKEMNDLLNHINEGDDDDEDIDPSLMPLVKSVMKNLLSKDLLYPSLKEISAKYPDWLKENESSISGEDHKRYSEQFHLMKQIVDQYEEEKSGESEEKSQKRLEIIFNLMQKMQKFGQPPKELIADAGGLELDENGLPKLPGINSNQCSIS